MAHDTSTDRGDPASSAERLRSMRLGEPTGWVPRLDDPRLPSDGPRAPAEPTGQSPAVAPAPADLLRGWLQDRLPPATHALIDRAGVGTLLMTVVVLVLTVVGGVMVWHHHSAATSPQSYDAAAGVGSAGSQFGGPSSSPLASTPPGAGTGAGTAATSIVVDVGGRVHKPGLVTLPPGARVADAITAAGGPLRHRELASIDLAARVSDGQLLVVGTKTAAPATTAGSSDPGAASSTAPVALNSATLEQLETLPDIGPVLGQNIIDWRTAHSGFTSVEQLQQVSGIGPATYADLSPLVTL
jgi:competence protein ComEA